MELSAAAVGVMSRQEQELLKARQGEDAGLISENNKPAQTTRICQTLLASLMSRSLLTEGAGWDGAPAL